MLPSYKLLSDIENSIDIDKVLEERILDSEVKFSLREVLGIAKRDIHDKIIEIIKRKRQVVDETKKSREKFDEESTSHGVECYSVGSQNLEIMDRDLEIVKSHFTRKHWARATTEAPVKVGGLHDPYVALIDQGSEINIMSTEVYKKGAWPIDRNHGWRVKVAASTTKELFGAVPNISVAIGDVELEQHFFVQDECTYPIILGEPYITGARMETKVLDDGSAYARIRSQDGKRAVQFLTVRANHDRNRDYLRNHPASTVGKESGDWVFP